MLPIISNHLVLSLAFVVNVAIWVALAVCVVLLVKWIIGVTGIVVPQVFYTIAGILLGLVVLVWIINLLGGTSPALR